MEDNHEDEAVGGDTEGGEEAGAAAAETGSERVHSASHYEGCLIFQD